MFRFALSAIPEQFNFIIRKRYFSLKRIPEEYKQEDAAPGVAGNGLGHKHAVYCDEHRQHFYDALHGDAYHAVNQYAHDSADYSTPVEPSVLDGEQFLILSLMTT